MKNLGIKVGTSKNLLTRKIILFDHDITKTLSTFLKSVTPLLMYFEYTHFPLTIIKKISEQNSKDIFKIFINVPKNYWSL